MSELTSSQERTRGAVEALIRLVEPGLNVILAAGDRLSRLVEPEDHEYYPGRPLEPPGQETVGAEDPAQR